MPCSLDPERAGPKATLAAKEELLPVPKWNNFVPSSVNYKTWAVDLSDAINIAKKVPYQAKAEVKCHSKGRQQGAL